MPGAQTELTSRLEISRRQFFQWHFVEKCHIPKVKEKMDELTRALRLAGYDYDFIAEEKSWKSRSRRWNALRKTAWKVGPRQKGRGLPIPADIANVPIWVEWDQDVGDWRNTGSNENNRSHTSVPQADEHQEPYQNNGHWDKQPQYPTTMQGRNGSRSSHALPMSSPTVPRISPHLFSLTEELPTSSYSPNPGTTTWPQQNVDHFTRTDPHSVLPSEQTLNTQHQHTDGSNPWYQDYPTATPAPPLSMPFSDAAHRNNQDMAAFMGDIDLSHMSPASRAASASGSCFSDYRCQGQSVYHNGYVAQPPSLSSPHQHLPADFPATQMSHSLGLPVPLWVPHQWNSPEHDSVSSQGTRGL